MQRRDFIKITAAGGAAAALEGCGNPDHHLIRFIPEEDLLPGIATWKPSICTLCPAGCGTQVRVMQGEAEVIRNGQLGILKMGLAKKIEGNPAHPINQGRLCPRGHGELQVTYHPDRIKSPLKRTGERGSGQYKEITWDEAIQQLVSQLSALRAEGAPKAQGRLAFVSAPLRGQRRHIVQHFVYGLDGLPPFEFEFFNGEVIRAANATTFGRSALPTVDLGQSNYVISFGADFLGTWNSPVAQAVGYGQMRKGRPGQRGKFVQVESRISQTGASADEFIACPPGSEGAFALSLAHVILNEKLRPVGAAGRAIAQWATGLPEYAPDKIEKQIGVSAATITRIAREAAANSPSVALIGDAATAHTNGLFNGLAVNALNVLLGSVDRPGGLLFSPGWEPKSERPVLPPGLELARGTDPNETLHYVAGEIISKSDRIKVLLLNGSNPAFASPSAWQIREAFQKVPFIASFGSFIDETSMLADLILPDHSPLESWLDDSPESGSSQTVVSLAPPAMAPLHNTRSMPDVLLDVAQQLGGDLAKALPWKTYDEALKASFTELYKEKGSKNAKDADDFWSKALAQGGWWSADEKPSAPASVKETASPSKYTEPQFDGSANDFPFYFLPFASQMFYDGSLAHLPWMQEAPDPLSSVMWGTWVEINNRTAEKLGLKMGDTLEVASAHGTLQAPALVTPAIAPDVIAMPVGQGHHNFTRYATGRGANPISILAPMTVEGTGSLAWAATRVKISRVGEGKLVMFGASMEETPKDLKHR
jgi:anaerobic selenocysteine-containing dehydrogenase